MIFMFTWHVFALNDFIFHHILSCKPQVMPCNNYKGKREYYLCGLDNKIIIIIIIIILIIIIMMIIIIVMIIIIIIILVVVVVVHVNIFYCCCCC